MSPRQSHFRKGLRASGLGTTIALEYLRMASYGAGGIGSLLCYCTATKSSICPPNEPSHRCAASHLRPALICTGETTSCSLEGPAMTQASLTKTVLLGRFMDSKAQRYTLQGAQAAPAAGN